MKHRGMTLLEVLVALSVFAIAAIAILKTTGTQAIGLGRLEEKTIAGWVADNQLTQIRLEQRWPGLSWVNGETTMADRQWYWRWRGVEAELENFRAVDVEVHSDPEFKNLVSSLRTYVVKM